MRVTKLFGLGLLSATAALLGSTASQAQYQATQYPGYGAQPQGQYQPYQAYQQPSQGYIVPQGPAPRVAMNFQDPVPHAASEQPVALPPTGADCNCQPAPAANYTMPAPVAAPAPVYTTPSAGCSTGQCSTGMGGVGYGGSPYGAYDCGNTGYNTFGCSYGAGAAAVRRGLGGGLAGGYGHGGNWFGGVYGLLMERDIADKVPLAFTAVDGTYPVGGYAPSDTITLTTRNVDLGYQGGFEARVGKWLGCDPCGCGPRWGVEGGYWQLFEESNTAVNVQSGTLRIYSMMDFRGLQYDPGTGYRPMNDYYDFGTPIQPDVGDPIRVDLARVRSSFEVINAEVNLLRVSLFGAGGFGVAAGPGIGYGAGLGGRLAARRGAGTCGYGGCDAGGCDLSGCTTGGCAAGGCDTCGGGSCGCGCGPRFSLTSLFGFRYLQIDESFMYGVDFTNTVSSATGFMNYHADVENRLYGFQIGSRGLYRLGCAGKWGLNFGVNGGIYGNDAEVHQYFDSPTGNVQYIATGDNFDVRATRSDVSFVGEIRAGLSYQHSCRTRLYGGWRAIGVTGVALATDQVPAAFIDPAHLNYVNTNGSLLLHGLQAGVEFCY